MLLFCVQWCMTISWWCSVKRDIRLLMKLYDWKPGNFCSKCRVELTSQPKLGRFNIPPCVALLAQGFQVRKSGKNYLFLIPPFGFCCETSRPQKITTLFQKQQWIMNSKHWPRMNDTLWIVGNGTAVLRVLFDNPLGQHVTVGNNYSCMVASSWSIKLQL